MYHPGLGTDQQLVQYRYAELLKEAADYRANRKARPARPQASISGLTLAFAASLPIIAGIALVVLTR